MGSSRRNRGTRLAHDRQFRPARLAPALLRGPCTGPTPRAACPLDAVLTTGPRTAAGKLRSSPNADRGGQRQRFRQFVKIINGTYQRAMADRLRSSGSLPGCGALACYGVRRLAIARSQKNAVAMPIAMSTRAPNIRSRPNTTPRGGGRDIVCGRLNRSTVHRHPRITAPLAAPILDAWRIAVRVNFAHAMNLTAARARWNRDAVRRRSIRSFEQRHTHLGMGVLTRCQVNRSICPDAHRLVRLPRLFRTILYSSTRRERPAPLLIGKLGRGIIHLIVKTLDQFVECRWVRQRNGDLRATCAAFDTDIAQFHNAEARTHVRHRLAVLSEHGSATIATPRVARVHVNLRAIGQRVSADDDEAALEVALSLSHPQARPRLRRRGPGRSSHYRKTHMKLTPGCGSARACSRPAPAFGTDQNVLRLVTLSSIVRHRRCVGNRAHRAQCKSVAPFVR